MENSNISLEEIQKSNLIIKAISSYYTSRSVGQRNLQISLLVSLIANGNNKKAEQLKKDIQKEIERLKRLENSSSDSEEKKEEDEKGVNEIE